MTLGSTCAPHQSLGQGMRGRSHPRNASWVSWCARTRTQPKSDVRGGSAVFWSVRCVRVRAPASLKFTLTIPALAHLAAALAGSGPWSEGLRAAGTPKPSFARPAYGRTVAVAPDLC